MGKEWFLVVVDVGVFFLVCVEVLVFVLCLCFLCFGRISDVVWGREEENGGVIWDVLECGVEVG